jgi:starch synthase (maltosyl-transferring)
VNGLRRQNAALLQTRNLQFAAVDSEQVIGFVKESADHENVIAVAIALAPAAQEFWFHFGDLQVGPPGARRHVRAVENLATGERRAVEWGGVRLRIDPADDPALFLRCIV